MTNSPVQSRLHGLKLRALVRDHLDLGDETVIETVDIGVGSAAVVDDDSWVLVDERCDRALGVALAWRRKARTSTLHVVTSHGAGDLARRAREFDLDIHVWQVHDRELMTAEVATMSPEVQPAEAHLAFVDTIASSGAEVVIEHGVVAGEVVGLEVCRVVDDEVTQRPRLDIGVGAHDREAFALMHADTPTQDSLRRIVDVVRGHRRLGADPHPLNRLGTERALRSRVVDDPRLIGAERLRAVASAQPRLNVKDAVACAALGETTTGEPLIAVFSTGIDLDVVPTAADIRLRHGDPQSRLVIVVPQRDASPITVELAASLRHGATVIGL